MSDIVLVTGGSGFVAIHCIDQLLKKGYKFRTTVPSLKKTESVKEKLVVAGHAKSVIDENLTSDKNWGKATEGCKCVLHMASPVLLDSKDKNDFLRPARDDTLRVLKHARDLGVKRVVLTSNFGAVGYSHKDYTKPITEESWTNPCEPNLSSYNKSKVLAEKAAWEFIKTEGNDLKMAVCNPMAVIGPAYSAELSRGIS